MRVTYELQGFKFHPAPCPYCGCAALLIKERGDHFVIQCRRCRYLAIDESLGAALEAFREPDQVVWGALPQAQEA